jgi:hypothetical protein
MKAVRAVYEKGRIKLAERPVEQGPVEVLVVFPEPSDDPWHSILNDSTPRARLAKWVKDVKKEIVEGKAKPLDVNDL